MQAKPDKGIGYCTALCTRVLEKCAGFGFDRLATCAYRVYQGIDLAALDAGPAVFRERRRRPTLRAERNNAAFGLQHATDIVRRGTEDCIHLSLPKDVLRNLSNAGYVVFCARHRWRLFH